MSKKPQSDSLLGWLGRQIGHVKKAVKTDVKKPPVPSATEPKIIYREDKIEEAPHPSDPGLKLRRTVIDEVIEDKDHV